MRHISLYHAVVIQDEQRFWKRMLIVDDKADVTLTLKAGIEEGNHDASKRIEVHTYIHVVVKIIIESCSYHKKCFLLYLYHVRSY